MVTHSFVSKEWVIRVSSFDEDGWQNRRVSSSMPMRRPTRGTHRSSPARGPTAAPYFFPKRCCDLPPSKGLWMDWDLPVSAMNAQMNQQWACTSTAEVLYSLCLKNRAQIWRIPNLKALTNRIRNTDTWQDRSSLPSTCCWTYNAWGDRWVSETTNGRKMRYQEIRIRFDGDRRVEYNDGLDIDFGYFQHLYFSSLQIIRSSYVPYRDHGHWRHISDQLHLVRDSSQW